MVTGEVSFKTVRRIIFSQKLRKNINYIVLVQNDFFSSNSFLGLEGGVEGVLKSGNRKISKTAFLTLKAI